jgi:hypothetical protein
MSALLAKVGAVPAGWRWLVWLVYAGAWTTALLMPVPDVGNWTVGDDKIDLRFLFSKFVHVSAYALLAALTGWLQVPARYRAPLLFVVMAHATVTELLQNVTPHRTGCLEDVGIDQFGIALGLLATWRWWTAPEGDRREAEGGGENAGL